MRRLGPVLVLLPVTACVREPAPAECPDVAVGALVITEVRGPQEPEDSNGPWIEVFNASGAEVDLAGVKIRFRRKDGSDEVPVLVRRAVPVAAGSYAVLGLFDDAQLPAFADYGFAGDFRDRWLAAAAIDLESCGELIDRATYDVLPDVGTFSFGSPPDADGNDLPAMWCVDPSSSGTPGAMNVACP